MSNYKISYLVLAITSGVYGFTLPTAEFAAIAQFLPLLFIMLLIASFIHDAIMSDKVNTH